MTRKETIQLLALLSATYPRFKLDTDELTINAWHEMLQDLPGDIVGVAVRRMISTLQYPPTIADIRQAVADSTQDATGAINAGEAWRKVMKAVSDYGYYQPEAARAYLGEDVWRAVEYIGGWSDMCVSEDPESVRSAQFERRYNAMLAQRKEQIQIPASVREDMQKLTAPLVAKMRIADNGNESAAPELPSAGNWIPYNAQGV